jgi:hypothetical protein
MDTRKPLSQILPELLGWCACEEDVHSVEHWIFHKQHSRRECALCGCAISDLSDLREHDAECVYVQTVKRCRGKQLTPWRRASSSM